jgi:hypothetical protein
VDFVCTSKRVGRALAKTEIADLALLDEFGHRSHRVLDRRVGVNAVLIEEIDRVDTQTLQRLSALLLDKRGVASDGAFGLFKVPCEFG